jgi:hypothetical protein
MGHTARASRRAVRNESPWLWPTIVVTAFLAVWAWSVGDTRSPSSATSLRAAQVDVAYDPPVSPFGPLRVVLLAGPA